MRKISRLTAVILMAAVIAALFASCSKKPSDSAAFKKLAESKGYEVSDITAQYVNAPQIKEAIITAPKDREFQIEFYTITDPENAKKLYQAQNEAINGYAGSEGNSNVSNGKNYAKRTVVTNDGHFVMVSYVENTVVYVPPTDKKHKDTIEKFLDEFKY